MANQLVLLETDARNYCSNFWRLHPKMFIRCINSSYYSSILLRDDSAIGRVASSCGQSIPDLKFPQRPAKSIHRVDMEAYHYVASRVTCTLNAPLRSSGVNKLVADSLKIDEMLTCLSAGQIMSLYSIRWIPSQIFG